MPHGRKHGFGGSGLTVILSEKGSIESTPMLTPQSSEEGSARSSPTITPQSSEEGSTWSPFNDNSSV